MSQYLLSGKSYGNFIQAVHSPDSRIVYKNSLTLYMKFRNIESCDSLIMEDPKIIQQSIIDYIIYLREELFMVARTAFFWNNMSSLD